jgi:REP element-mobilizing transposase RayT
MKYDPSKHHRRSIRLKGYDYSQAGAYFVTICTHNRECLFGKINDGTMFLNEMGEIAKQCWLEIPNHFPNVTLDEFVIMPNHIHGIIIINDNGGANDNSPPQQIQQNKSFRSPSRTIGSIIRGYKIGVTKLCRQNAGVNNNSPLQIWQRNYYEHIIRNENELNKIRQYIINNPLKWSLDFENPVKKTDYKNIQEYFERII